MRYLLLTLVLVSLGCASNPQTYAEQIHAIRATHVELKETAIALITSGVITDQATKDVIWAVSQEIYDGCNEAEMWLGQSKDQQVAAVLRRVRIALTRFAILVAKHKEQHSWVPPKLQPSFLPASRLSVASRRSTTRRSLDYLPQPRKMSSYGVRTSGPSVS